MYSMYVVLFQFILVLLCSPTLLNGQEPLSLEGRNKACDVLVAVDESLYNRHDGNMTFLVDLAKQHIKVGNSVPIFVSEAVIFKFLFARD